MKTKDQEQKLYESVIKFYSTPASIEYYSRKLDEDVLFPPEEAMIRRYMRLPADVLDIGCGTGRITFYLYRLGFRVKGTDITPALVEAGNSYAKKRGIPALLKTCNGRDLPYPDSTFDHVLLVSQMIHCVPLKKNRVALLKEAERVCGKQGKIIITYHDIDILRKEKPWDPDFHYNPDMIGKMTESFDILESGDGFDDNCQGKPVDQPGYGHNFTQKEMEDTVKKAGLVITDRDSFRTVAGGEPDSFWSATQILVISKNGHNRGNQ